MNDSSFPDRPLTEEEWLAEFRRSDVRAARFGELLETLIDDPDRDRIIAREMGWDDFAEELDAPTVDDDDAPDDFVDDEEASFAEPDERSGDAAAGDGATFEEILAEEEEHDREEGLPPLSEIPAFCHAMDLARLVIQLDRAMPEDRPTDARRDELYGEILSNVLIPAAKLRAGHTYGYEERICGNIVLNRFALEAAENAERALLELQALGGLSDGFAEQILPRVRELQQSLHERIAEMRARVWWSS